MRIYRQPQEQLPTGNSFNKEFSAKQEMYNNKPRIIIRTKYCGIYPGTTWHTCKKRRTSSRNKSWSEKRNIKEDKEVDKWKEQNPTPPEG
eukprot:15332233-Ditylum_brightwellii.AAC.1